MFHINHNWTYYGTKGKWVFKDVVDIWLYPERKCLTCSRVEQLEGCSQSGGHVIKDYVQIYKSRYEADPLLDAVKAVYYAGKWSCPDVKELDAVGLWTDLRDAAGFEPGGTSK